MSRNTSISLGTHFDAFIEAQVKDGRFSSASEVVRAGLRLLEEHEARVKALRQALLAGEESGEAEPFEDVAFRSRMLSGPPPSGAVPSRSRAYTVDEMRLLWEEGIASGDARAFSESFLSTIKREGRERLAKGK